MPLPSLTQTRVSIQNKITYYFKKKKQTYKPDSVSKLEPYHLSRPNITAWLKLPTLQHRTRNSYSEKIRNC